MIEAHVKPAGPVELAHERPWSTVLRVPLADGVAWFKACSRVQAFEPGLTVQLSARWPDRVPEVLACDGIRGWLLMADAGTRIGDLGNLPEYWLVMLPLYAELQRGPREKGTGAVQGNRQKVQLIAALVTRADLLVLDEPTSGLDPLMEMTFRECGTAAKERGQKAGANCLPIAALFLGIAALAYAVVPRASAAIAYAILTVSFLWQAVGALLGAPGWLVGLTPFAHVGLVPAEPFRAGAAAITAGIGLAAALAALAAFRRRDLLGA